MTLRIGLPQWQHPGWKRAGLHTLEDYARHFDCVEGNTTLYALPEPETVLRWRAMTGDDFRFCFKFPATISHSAALKDCQQLTSDFFRRLDPLSARIGEYWLQLPARFAPQQLPQLWAFLEQLPDCFHYGVEVRHPDFFARGEAERALNRGLADRGVNRVILDSRAVHASASTSAASLDAKGKKPRLPVHALCTAQQPMIRFIGSEETADSVALFNDWTPKLLQWQMEHQPLLFIHTPDMGEVFPLLHQLWPQLQPLSQRLADLPEWPEQESLF